MKRLMAAGAHPNVLPLVGVTLQVHYRPRWHSNCVVCYRDMKLSLICMLLPLSLTHLE